jgi:glutathione S-transferase
MSLPRLYGAEYSVYARIARLVLAECRQDYDMVEVDIFEPEKRPTDYGRRQPFGKIPAFEQDGFLLYETDAIAHYVNEALGGGRLLPFGPRQRARCLQMMRIVDNYAYRALVWDVYVAEKEEGRQAIPATVREAAERVLGVLEDLHQGPYFCGAKLSLADLWLLPVYAYARLAPSGPGLLQAYPKLAAWWRLMADRPAVQATRFPDECGRSN